MSFIEVFYVAAYSIIGAPFVDIRAKLDLMKNMMPAPSLGVEQCNLIG